MVYFYNSIEDPNSSDSLNYSMSSSSCVWDQMIVYDYGDFDTYSDGTDTSNIEQCEIVIMIQDNDTTEGGTNLLSLFVTLYLDFKACDLTPYWVSTGLTLTYF